MSCSCFEHPLAGDLHLPTTAVHFSSRQREAVIEAAALAGWNVIGLINEPTAAAMAYGFFVAGQKRVRCLEACLFLCNTDAVVADD